jgi:threonine dehydratase
LNPGESTDESTETIGKFVRMTFKPGMIEVREARKLLATYLRPTRTVLAGTLSRNGSSAFLKLETELPTGSFKVRGALYALALKLKKEQIIEVTAHSTGNHGAAVAYAAKILQVPATIFLPSHPNAVKRDKIRNLGARVVEKGADSSDAFEEAREYSRRPGVYFLNDATDPDLPAGPATIALEIAEQVPEVETIYVPMGDTALIRSVAAAMKQLRSDVRIIGVQAERAPSYYLSWKAGKAITTDTCDTCADGLATRTPDAENVNVIRELVDDVLLVSEAQFVEAVHHLYHREGVLAEPAGAASTAAFLSRPSGKTAVLLVTGANISDQMRRQAGIPLSETEASADPSVVA